MFAHLPELTIVLFHWPSRAGMFPPWISTFDVILSSQEATFCSSLRSGGLPFYCFIVLSGAKARAEGSKEVCQKEDKTKQTHGRDRNKK